NQAHGAPANLLDLYAVADVPETEMFSRGGGRDPRVSRFDEKFGEGDRSPLVSKFASSAAHVAGHRLVSAETGTWMAEHFCETLEELKCLVDLLLVSGVNHVIYHGCCYSPDDAAWPGWLFYASTEMNPRNSIWRDAPALNSYIARCQVVLQSGRPDSDILLYWPIHDLWSAPPRKSGDGTDLRHLSVHDRGWLAKQPMGAVAKTLWDGGWGFDYVSDRQLAAAKAKGGDVVTPGATYRVVVVPPCERMPVATLEQLFALARGGCTVVFAGALPRDVPGLARLDERSAELRALLAPVAPEGGGPAAAGKLVVTSARYGAGETWIDVTEIVRKHARGDRLSIKVDVPKPFPDPLVGTVKTLEVEYVLGGRAGRRSARDRTTLVIEPHDVAPTIRDLRLGRGRVIVGGRIAEALGLAGIKREQLADHPGARFIRRRHAGGRHYFIANQGMKLMDAWFALATPAKSAVLMNPMTGRAGVAGVRQADARAEVRLRVEPGHSVILRTFESRSVRGEAWRYLAPGEPAKEVHGPWRVRFVEGGPALPKEYETRELASWTKSGDPEAERFAGGAVYRATFDAPGGEGPWVLDLGDVCHSARVRLNGRELGTLIMNPYRVPVERLESTGNVLDVEVTNLSANRIRDLDRRKVKWRIFHNINFVNIRYRPFDASKWPVFESGLLGPVVLRRAKETQ
ncbi:MAG: glycosyl hydrolase, partial [Planctomycetota bacterium]